MVTFGVLARFVQFSLDSCSCKMIYNSATNPNRKRFLIFGGLAAVVVAIVIIVIVSVTVTSEATDILLLQENTPLIIGSDNLPDNLNALLRNDLAAVDFASDLSAHPAWGSASCPSCHTDLARLRAGGVAALFLVASSACSTQYKDGAARILEQVDVIVRLAGAYPDWAELVTSAEGASGEWWGLEQFGLLEFERIRNAQQEGKVGILVAAGGGYAFDSRLALLRLLQQLGVRYIRLTPGCNTPWISGYVDPHENVTLTPFGEEVVKEMNRLGVIVDLSGASEEAARLVLGATRAPAIFSTSGARGLVDHGLNLADDTLELLKENGGVVMVNFDASNIAANATNFTISDVIEHINHIVNKIGHDYVGIGGNFDSAETRPSDLRDVSHLPALFEKLAENGWTEENLQKLAGENFLRVFEEVEKVGESLRETEEARATWINATDFNVVPNGQVFQCRTRT